MAEPTSKARKEQRRAVGEPPPLREVERRALFELARLIGAPAERVIELHKSDQGWAAMIEVLEMSRVPETSDILADYEVELTARGSVLGFRRTRRYLRAEVEGR